MTMANMNLYMIFLISKSNQVQEPKINLKPLKGIFSGGLENKSTLENPEEKPLHGSEIQR